MTRDVKGLPPNGPVKEIDWDFVDDLLIRGCTGTQIASRLGVHPQTLYNRCEDEKGSLFSEYAQRKREKGDTLLLETQFNMAIEKDRAMLIWLGKQRLGQKENPGAMTIPPEFAELFAQTMNAIAQMQGESKKVQIDLNSDDTSISNES
jgi:hypothetical protein